MADNNLARSRNDVPDFFADGDPLAELARIVGYEERVVAKPDPLSVPAASVAAERRDPVFNLEDELLREFERYDAPRLDPVDDVGVVEPAAPVAAYERDHVEPVFEPAPQSYAPAFDDHADVAFGDEASSPAEPWHAGAVQAVSQAFSEPAAQAGHQERLDDDGFDFVSPTDFASAEPEMELPVSVAVEPVVPTAAEEFPYASEVAAPESAPASYDNFDLAEELETSIVAAPAAQPVPDVRRKESFTPSFRMPIANFRSGAGVVSDRPVAPKVDVPAPMPAPVASAPKVEEQPFQNWSFTAPASAAPIVAAAAQPLAPAPVAPVAVPALEIPLAGPAEPVAAKPAVEPRLEVDQFSALDELLYDVDRYSKASHVEAPAVAVAPVIRNEPVVADLPKAAAPAVAAPSLDDDIDPFADVEFELALDDLELDLADMVGEENKKIVEPVKAPAVTQSPIVAPAPVVTQVVVAPQVAAAAPSVAPVASPVMSAPAMTAAPVIAAAPIVAAPVVAAAQPVQQAPAAAAVATDAKTAQDDGLAFDPALIADSEEHVEAIAELDVPALPVTEAEEPPLYRNDFDLDIDAELASLLEAPEAAASMRGDNTPAQPVAAPVQPAAAASGQSIYSDLDDFERALEEDFRRSLATPLQANDERYADHGNYVQDLDGEEGGRSVRRWIAPLAAVGILAVCGAGAYAWLGNSGPGAGNGEPIVIAADNDPVKVAPANPGGKTVPNQDKAVYDRVAGAASQMPRQEQLISSSEEPVDVVQKTLMPDNLPLEGENDVQMTDVADTEDPRLLPQEQADASQPTDQQAVTVMPRKVKTMIVRADGTLVEQEIEAPAAAVGVEKVAAAPARGDSPAAPQQTAAAFPTAASSTPAAATPVSAPVTDPVATVQPVSTEPSAIEQLAAPTAASNVRAPVPATRPQQQANAVASVSDQGNARPAPAAPTAQAPAAAPAAQNTQVASAAAGGYVIQIASLPSQADAQKSYQNLSNKFGSVIGGRGVDIKAAEIAGKGTFYRVRIPAGANRAEAVALCERYRSAGGSCLVAR
ncbi:Sporulation related domain-containing protein [Rhizobium sp. NFR07]|uniref:SPOR domain-containing protein n=1 Tax=Rhizobium sp. NFR07 TaxID=1566262 RepID=UPI0008EA9A1A|nr:SPOR domain-containing protein [Rhizobium sp. NFR07]SFB42661.1 Sporulation related domain-containing protein [Rhizobium sp. NFR07]